MRLEGNLWRSSGPTLLFKQGHPEHVAQDRVRAGFEYPRRRRLRTLFGQPVPAVTFTVKTGPSTDLWGTLSHRPPTRFCTTDHNPPSSALQPILSPPHCPLIYITLPELANEDVVGDSVKCLAEVKVDNIYCSLLIYPCR